MSKTDSDRRAAEAFAALSADVTRAPSAEAAKRLRSVIASALRASIRAYPAGETLPPALTRLSHVVPDSLRESLIRDRDSIEPGDVLSEAIAVIRRDDREMLLLGRPVDHLTALLPTERIGPFGTHGGIDIWFDIFLAARRMEVKETGVSAPAMVFTQARPPLVRRATTTIDIEPGTVWIRGDLVDASLPPSAYVGIKVVGGSLRLSQQTTVTDNVIEVAPSLKGVLRLDLAADSVTPVAGACTSNAKAELPESMTFTFDAGSSTVVGAAGKADVWGQTFNFGPSTGDWTLIERLWTIVLGYDVQPRQFDARPIGDDLVHFQGKGGVSRAGLGLPVVVATNPAILGETAFAASWFLQIRSLTARWYTPDPRPHDLKDVWVGISAFGATILAEGVAPLTPFVVHTYDLWTIAGGSNKRLPWRQAYKEPFLLFYRCHAVDGELFMVQGQAGVALDRPVTTNGLPTPTPTTQSTLLLHRFGGVTTAALGALIDDAKSTHQFALQNALVWTTAPAFIFVRGELVNPQQLDSGGAQLLFGVYGWAPTLPDPYVSNGFVRRPRSVAGVPHSLLQGRIVWTTPDNVRVSFEGQLGPSLSLGARGASPGDPRPARDRSRGPDVGLTQVEQEALTFDEREEAEWKRAQAEEAHSRGQRIGLAQKENGKTAAIIDGFMREVVGPPPNLTLLDVSTNQDLLGVAVGGRTGQDVATGAAPPSSSGSFPVSDLTVHSELGAMRVVMLPQTQWEPVRTLDSDQDIMTMGWFPTPLASATDGGATQIGARSQKLMPVIPEFALRGTFDAFKDGTPVGIRTTFPFGLVSAIRLQPNATPGRKADLYHLTRPKFPTGPSVGGIQVTAKAEGGRPDDGGISPTFQGQMRQLLNGVDLASGAPLGISVLGETLQPAGSVETVFNNDMAARPRVPVTRIDLSGYGGSNFSDWNNPFAAFAEAAKVQFTFMIGRTALEVIKVNSVLHPWGIRVTRSVTIERRPGGGVIRRDSGWQAFTPGIFDYRYFDTVANDIVVAPYEFDAGVFRGLFNVRTIRPAPGNVFSHGGATLVPYYFDAEVALQGVPGRTAAVGILGYLQTTPNGAPAAANALQALVETQGPIGGPIEAWMNFGGSGLPFRAQRVEVGLAMNGGAPLFVATVRGVPSLPATGAWSVVVRPVASVPPNGGEAVPVADNRGVPVIRRYPVRYLPGDRTAYSEPRLDGAPGDYRFADATDLLTPAAPQNDYGLLQSTPTHAFLFPRPFVPASSPPRIESGHKSALADIFARSTSKGAFPPAGNTIEMAPGSLHFDVSPAGRLALSTPVSIVGHPTPLRIGGTPGHGSSVFYDTSTLRLELEEHRWEAEFTGLRVWSDISGLERITGSEMRIVGSTDQRPQIAEIKSLMLQEIEDILQYIPIFGQRGVQGPVDLGATNAKHELKVDVGLNVTVPPPAVIATFPAGTGVVLKLYVKQNTGIDLATGGPKASATFGADLDGKIPVLSLGVAAVFIIIAGKITFSLTSVSGSVTSERLDLLAFVGVGVEGKIGPFKAYAFLGVGFVFVYDAIADVAKYGGLVALEAGVDLVIVSVKIRAELKGVVYDDAGTTKCDYSGSVKVQVDIFLIFSISATYLVTETTSF
jgi:hypothetical protein